MLYNISLQLILYIIVCTSYSPPPILLLSHLHHEIGIIALPNCCKFNDFGMIEYHSLILLLSISKMKSKTSYHVLLFAIWIYFFFK